MTREQYDLHTLIVVGRGLQWRRNSNPTLDSLIQDLIVIRTKDKGAAPMQLNRAQLQYSRQCTKRNIVLKARQVGITTYIAARYFLKTITRPGSVTVQVAHDQDSAEEIFKIVHRFWKQLPPRLRKGALERSHANVGGMIFSVLDSEYRVASAADPEAGRGMTIHNLHCSEVARWPAKAEETLASLRAAVPRNGEIVLESTPNGAGGAFYQDWQRARETGYTQHFFPWWFDDSYKLEGVQSKIDRLTADEQKLVDAHSLTLAQIAWRRQNRAQLRGLAVQEFAEDSVSCFRASGECVFELSAVEKALETSSEPAEVKDNGRLHIYFHPQAGKRYIIGADPAGGGTEGDYSCAQVLEVESALQCAELHGHYPPREFAAELVRLAKMYNGALLIVEMNNHGHAVLEHVRHLEYDNIPEKGWLTTSVTRPSMIENLAATLVEHSGLIRSRRLLSECRTFVRHADGSSSASSGAHDDCVMAMAIALGARQRHTQSSLKHAAGR